MFDIGLQEMLLIGVLALLVFGPTKLPELGRMVGRAMREFRRASEEFRSTVETNLNLNESEPLPASTVTTATDVATTPGVPLPSETEPSADGAVPAVATAIGPEDLGEPFCAQRGSRLFHRRDCAWARRIPADARVPLASVAEGRAQGFATCPVCEPWEPA
jgi:Tat protein translocase TatB subunit